MAVININDERRVKEYSDWIKTHDAIRQEHLTQIAKIHDKINAMKLASAL